VDKIEPEAVEGKAFSLQWFGFFVSYESLKSETLIKENIILGHLN